MNFIIGIENMHYLSNQHNTQIMNKKILNIIVAIICLASIVFHFVRSPENERLFGFEVPNYLYLLFWGVCLFGSVMNIRKAGKANS